MFECEYFTDALGVRFPKRVKSNEIRILVDNSSHSVDFRYPSSFTSEERKSRLTDLKVISSEIEKISSFISSKPLSTSLVVKIGSSIEGILNKVLPKLINHDYKVTYWVQE